MSDEFWIALAVSFPATVGSVAAATVSLVGLMRLNTVHKQINGRMGELIELTAKSSKAEGVKQELDRDKGDS